jgi:hypothetical protein
LVKNDLILKIEIDNLRSNLTRIRACFASTVVTNAIFHVPAGTYVSTGTLFKDGTNCDALYTPAPFNLSGLPPIILELQRTVNMEFLRRSTRYCLNTCDRFCSSSVLVVFCNNGIASTSISNNFTSHHHLPYFQAVPVLTLLATSL